tara:strand:- start:30 stop:209 length:180 start_codon:yes stop_codon:yes gene_type:complete
MAFIATELLALLPPFLEITASGDGFDAREVRLDAEDDDDEISTMRFTDDDDDDDDDEKL